MSEATADVVAHAELHRKVVSSVLALDEPFRTAVLLRFFDGIPPREIAARTATTAETARTRVRRGIEALRERFDREHNGDRRAWMAALIALAGPSGDATPAGERPLGHAMPVASSTAGISSRLRWAALGVVGAAAAIATLAIVRPWEPPTSARNDEPAESVAATSPREPESKAAGDLAARPTAPRDEPRSGLRPARVEGRVRTPAGKPVAGAVVLAFGAEPVWLSDSLPVLGSPARTDAAGRYVLSGLIAREATVVARADGFVVRGLALVRTDGSNPLAVDLREGETVERDLVLEPATAVEGVVLDANGTPAAGASVRVDALAKDAAPGEQASWIAAGEATTREDGTFRLTGVPSGTRIRVEARLSGRSRAMSDPLWSPDDLAQPLRLQLRAARSIEVRVVEGKGETPVADAFVGAQDPIDTQSPIDFTAPWTRYGPWKTGPDGRARLLDLPDAKLMLLANATSSDGERRGGGAMAEMGVAEVTIRFKPNAPREAGPGEHALRVRVLGPDGKPVPGGWLSAYRSVSAVASGGSSFFRFREGVVPMDTASPPAKFAEAFGAEDADGRPLPYGAAFVEVGGRSEVEIQMPRERTLRGRVVEESGLAAVGVLVRARPARWAERPLLAQEVHSQARTDAHGEFELHQLADEAYDVVTVAPMDRAVPAAVRVEAGRTDVVVTLRAAETVVVKVVDGDAAPVAGVEVGVWRPDVPMKSRRRGMTPPLSAGRTDAQGLARLQRLDFDGPFVVRLDPPVARKDLVRHNEESWIPKETTTFDLSAAVRIRVVDAGGAPVAGARVFETKSGRAVEVGVADGDGRFLWRGLNPNSATRAVAARPEVEADELSRSFATCKVSRGDSVTMVVHPGAPIDVDVTGAPEGDATSVAAFVLPPYMQSMSEISAAPLKDGTARLYVSTIDEPLAIEARTQNRSHLAVATGVRVGGGRVRLAMAPSLRISGRVTAPASVAEVTVHAVQVDGPVYRTAKANERGEYSIDGLLPGRYRVLAVGSSADRRRVELEGGDAEADAGSTLDFTLHE